MITQQCELPEDTWSLTQLGKYCRQREGQMAIDAWCNGKAAIIAKRKTEEDGTSFTGWKRQHGLSDATYSRYMRLPEFYGEDQLDHLKEIGISRAYKEAGIVKGRASTGASAKDDKLPSWAIEPADEEMPDLDEQDMFIEMWSRSECLKEELRKEVPWQVSHLKDKVVSLLENDSEALEAGWSEDECIRRRISTDIDILVEVLPRLAATLSVNAKVNSA